jgi:hypothetical protein
MAINRENMNVDVEQHLQDPTMVIVKVTAVIERFGW